MTRIRAIDGLDAAAFACHPLHAAKSDWPESNCYVDLWIELLHALGLEPLALLGHALPAAFLGDQWTFFKPPPGDLRELYGIDVQELTVWRPMLDHAVEHLSAGRLIASEVDSHWLPDTAGTDYRRQHTKTTIVFASLDTDARRLGYFHNAGYFELEGEDFDRIFAPLAGGAMPLFAELVCIDRRVALPPAQLGERAMKLLSHHLQWRPQANPFTGFAPRFEEELAQLHSRGLPYYHQWAFASLRQAGAAFELSAAHVEWLARLGHPCGGAAQPFRTISATCKSLILKGARVAATGKPFDARPAMQTLAGAWDQGMQALASHGMMSA